MSHSTARVWFVTGSSSGFGKSLVEHLLDIGERVVATLRKPDVLASLATRYFPSQLLLLELDVTNAEQVKDAFEATRQHFGRVDVVVNNAGYGMCAEFETFPEKEARAMMEVLFWGPVNICKEAIRFMRDVNPEGQGGRIINISSMGGFIAYPTGSYYHAGKFALEAMTESFSKELLPEWNIKVMIIEPGGFRTEYASNLVKIPVPPQYNKTHAPTLAMRKLINQPLVGDAVKAARAIVRLAGLEDPPMRIQLGTESLLAVRIKAQKTIENGKRWEELAHSTNADDVDKDKIMERFAQIEH